MGLIPPPIASPFLSVWAYIVCGHIAHTLSKKSILPWKSSMSIILTVAVLFRFCTEPTSTGSCLSLRFSNTGYVLFSIRQIPFYDTIPKKAWKLSVKLQSNFQTPTFVNKICHIANALLARFMVGFWLFCLDTVCFKLTCIYQSFPVFLKAVLME